MLKMPNLKLARNLKGLTQTELSIRAGVNRTTLSDIERGAKQTLPRTAKKIADALEVELRLLISEDAGVLGVDESGVRSVSS